jgi:hypothetical protein
MPRKSKLALRRSAAARRGWITRRWRQRAGWYTRRKYGREIRCGYQSSKDNSFAMEIKIRTHRPLAVKDLQSLIEKLLRKGHFNYAENSSTPDLTWTPGLINSFYVLRENIPMRAGTAYLLDFSREQP